MTKTVAIIGAGPAGLMAAEVLARAGCTVTIYERKPAAGRKFLMAGRGGLNLTHSEDIENFMKRYGTATEKLRPAITAFTPAQLRDWCEGLGQETFVGTSGRIFPKAMKASPLLRAWLIRLSELGVTFCYQHEWLGWADKALHFKTADGAIKTVTPDATILALGGASWPKLGADGGWMEFLRARGVEIVPFRPANCGFAVAWSDIFKDKHAGAPLKAAAFTFNGKTVRGEAMIAAIGIEGGAVYALSAGLRDACPATLTVDLKPDTSQEILARALSAPRGTHSFSNFLRRVTGLAPVAAALVREAGGAGVAQMPAQELAALIKAIPLRLDAPFPLDRAISSAGGVALDAVDNNFMLKKLPGVYAVGEMLDWEAPTGGYLLQACFSTAMQAARRIAA